MLLPPEGERHALKSSELFIMPVELETPQPEFPPDFPARQTIELTVCAEVWLSDEGGVERVVPLRDATGCGAEGSGAFQALFERTVTDALMRWEFSPARICTLPPGADERRERGDCTGPDVTLRPVPVRLAYAFSFSVREGKRLVGFVRKPQPAIVPARPAE